KCNRAELCHPPSDSAPPCSSGQRQWPPICRRRDHYSGTYAGFGTAKATRIGKERLSSAWDENGLTLTNGATDHMSLQCWGTSDFVNGVGQDQGYCVGTDPAGDQIFQIMVTEKRPMDQKSYGASVKSSGGTGKYIGVTGEEHDVCHSGEFKMATEG